VLDGAGSGDPPDLATADVLTPPRRRRIV